jgi:hypothetical protein
MRYFYLFLILITFSHANFIENSGSVYECQSASSTAPATSCYNNNYYDGLTYVYDNGTRYKVIHRASASGCGYCSSGQSCATYYSTTYRTCSTTAYIPNETYFELDNGDIKLIDTLENNVTKETTVHNETGTKSIKTYNTLADGTQDVTGYQYINADGSTEYDMTFQSQSAHIDFNDGSTLDTQYNTIGDLEKSIYQSADGSQSQTVYTFNEDGSGTMETLTITGDTKEYTKDTFDTNGNLTESITTQLDANNGLSGYSSTAGLFTVDSTNNTPLTTGGTTPNYDMQTPETGVTYNGFGDSNGTLSNIINLRSNAVTCDTTCDDGAPAINQNGTCHCDRVCEAVNYDTVDGACQSRSNVDCNSLTVTPPTGFYIDNVTSQEDCINKATYSYIDSAYVTYPDYSNCPNTWFCLVHDVEENPIDQRIQDWIDNYNNDNFDPNGDSNDNSSDGDTTDNSGDGSTDDTTDDNTDSNNTTDSGDDTNGTLTTAPPAGTGPGGNSLGEYMDDNTEAIEANTEALNKAFNDMNSTLSEQTSILGDISDGISGISDFVSTVSDFIDNPTQITDVIDSAINEASTKYSNTVIQDDSSCQSIGDISFDFLDKHVILLNQSIIDNHIPVELIRYFLYITAVLVGAIAFFKGS